MISLCVRHALCVGNLVFFVSNCPLCVWALHSGVCEKFEIFKVPFVCWPYVVLCEDVEIFIVPRCGSFVVLFEDFDLNSSIVLWCGDFFFKFLHICGPCVLVCEDSDFFKVPLCVSNLKFCFCTYWRY